MARHFGLDWLRIGAFALLIFYHVGMVFVPWGFHVQTAVPADWVAIPMMAINPWRLALLFVVSGYASRALLAKGAGLGAFARSRSARLLVPLLFGVIIVVPIQPWIELTTQHGYTAGFWTFLARDYWAFGTIAGIILPTWQHLWFVGYLWLYTMLLAVAATLLGGRSLQRGFDAVFGGIRLWLLPTAWLMLVSAWLFPGGRETHALFGDWVAHATYLPCFLFGFAFAGSRIGFAATARYWPWAAAVAAIAYAVVIFIEHAWPVDIIPPYPFGLIFSAARAVQGWSAIVALIGIADRFWNRDHPWRSTLTEAVFPFYIIHQTVIVAVEFVLLPYRLPAAVEFVILVVATVAGCWIFYLIGRNLRWLRPLIGLRARAGPAPHQSDARVGRGLMTWTLMIHGGAGMMTRDTLTPEQDLATRAGLNAALDAGTAVLAARGAALDAVAAAIRVLEDDPAFNSGRGAALTWEGKAELDAAIMDGRDRRAGAVAGATTTRNPVDLARAVMEDGAHVMLSGAGADAFSVARGRTQAGPDWFVLPERAAQLAELKARGGRFDVEMKYGTVGAVARDADGHVAAGTSTGGVTGKRWGRIGDSPLIGAGTYADDRACAVSATGAGEFFIRAGVAHEIAARVRLAGETIADAAAAVMADVTALGGTGGVIVAAPDGDLTWRFTTPGMNRGRATSLGEREVAIYGDE